MKYNTTIKLLQRTKLLKRWEKGETKMKKLITLILTVMLGLTAMFSLVGCGKGDDLKSVLNAKKLVVGVTIYEPMDYPEEGGEGWVGFDAELAQQFAKSLGEDVNCQIVIITWANKVAELKSKQIDLIWNGMTASDDLAKEIDLSVSYAKNAQVAVVKNTSSIASKEDIKNAKVAVEAGSAGNTVATEEEFKNINAVTAQVDALTEVASGTSDVAIIDITMAQSVVGKGAYSNLKILNNASYGDEIFAVGLRKGSNLKAKLDQFLKDKYKDGTMTELAEKYGVGLNTEALSK